MFNKLLIKTLKNTINELQEEKEQLANKNKDLERDCIILLETNREQRKRIVDLENNVEFLVNNLTPKKRAVLGLEKNLKNKEENK